MTALAAGRHRHVDGSDYLIVTGLDPEQIADLVSEQGLRLDEPAPKREPPSEAFIDLLATRSSTRRASWAAGLMSTTALDEVGAGAGPRQALRPSG